MVNSQNHTRHLRHTRTDIQEERDVTAANGEDAGDKYLYKLKTQNSKLLPLLYALYFFYGSISSFHLKHAVSQLTAHAASSAPAAV
jgi:hypothetical protein